MQADKIIRAKDLRPNDVCAGSGQKILAISWFPGWKYAIVERETRNGKILRGSWNASTTIGIIRKEK